MVRAVFLDRDGVINRKMPEGRYVTGWAEVQFLPGVAEAVKYFREAGFLVLLVSNQRAIAKGLITHEELESLHRRMWHELFQGEKSFDGVYYCPHDIYPACACRKPQPGMLFAAAQDWGIDLTASWMVGDSESDVEAGRTAGCRTIRIGLPEVRFSTAADEVAGSLREAANIILTAEPAASPISAFH